MRQNGYQHEANSPVNFDTENSVPKQGETKADFKIFGSDANLPDQNSYGDKAILPAEIHTPRVDASANQPEHGENHKKIDELSMWKCLKQRRILDVKNVEII